jgi:hypothetical protein
LYLCLIKHYAMKMYGEWRYSSTILDISSWWLCVVSFMPWLLYPQHPLDRRLSGPQNQSGHCGEEKIFRPFWKSNLGYSACILSLYEVSYPSSERESKKKKKKRYNKFIWISLYCILKTECLCIFRKRSCMNLETAAKVCFSLSICD